MKTYMQPGEYSYFAKRKIRCKEVSPLFSTSVRHCNYCCLRGSLLCSFVRCQRHDRPDGKDVIFVYTKTREKK